MSGQANWHYIWRRILAFSRWPAAFEWTLSLSGLSILLFGLAQLADIEALGQFLTFVWKSIFVLVWIAVGAIGVAAFFLGLGVLLDSKAPRWLLILEVVALVGLVPLPYLAKQIRISSIAVYGSPDPWRGLPQ